MKFTRVISLIFLATIVVALVLVSQSAEAGKKRALKKAALAAMMLKSGKKILLPLPIPIPIPFLKQKEPVYYPQQSYSQDSYDQSSSSQHQQSY